MTASPTPTPHPQSGIWAQARALVFLGFHVQWRARISDAEMHTRHAEAWEPEFSSWTVGQRTLSLGKPAIGYYVDLRDGEAYFRCESAAAYDEALRHAGQLVATLVQDKRERAVAAIEAQQLLSVDEPFEVLVARLQQRLLNDSILRATNARPFDLAYLVDTRINGRFFQFNIGPVRDFEIRRRVAARGLAELPPVALFCSIATRKPYEYEMDELSSYVLQTIELGNILLRELDP